MAYVARVEDGVLLDNDNATTKEELPKGSDLGYDEFLQLLCAEMQYQDPLEPTSNTEYVAQLATFSQLEATISMQGTLQDTMANDLVGKTVILKFTNETTGKDQYIDGKVDYVLYEGDDIYLSVNDSLYPISYLDTVADVEYYEAMGLSKSIESMLEQMPDVDNLTAYHEEMVNQITDLYDGMTDYQKQFVDSTTAQNVEAYRKRMQEVLEIQKKQEELAAASGTDETKETGDTESEGEEGITEV